MAPPKRDESTTVGNMGEGKAPLLRHPAARGEEATAEGSNSSSEKSSDVRGCPQRASKVRSVSSSDAVRQSHCASNVSEDEDGVVLVHPKLRGKIHLALLMLAPVWILLLLSACGSLRSFVAAIISCFSFLANFAASALLHCFHWSPQWRNFFSKVDHAGIFVVISSCTTPIPMLLLDFWPSFFLLSVQGVATLYGFWTILFGDLSSGARKRRASTYIFIGLLHAIFLKQYISVLTAKEVRLVLLLAVFYVVGALVYGSRWPDPCPTHFGFHELFHVCCGFSFLLTLWLNYEVITRAESARSPGYTAS